MTDIDPRDVARIENGLPPIFVKEPRPLTAQEVKDYWGDVDESERPTDAFMKTYEPCVMNGYLIWRKREHA